MSAVDMHASHRRTSTGPTAIRAVTLEVQKWSLPDPSETMSRFVPFLHRIIQYYVLRETSGTLAPPKSDFNKVSFGAIRLAVKALGARGWG